MILTNIKHFKRYEGVHPLFKKVMYCLKHKDFLSIDLGRVEIEGDKLFINNVLAKGISADKQPMEMHRDYIDIHVLLHGKERIGFKSTERVENFTQKYKKDGDCALTDDVPTSYVDLVPNDMCIVFPEDAHAPLIGDGEIRKLIIKVRV